MNELNLKTCAKVIRKVLFFSLSLLVFSAASKAQDKFTLDGFVEGYEGEVKLILNPIKPNHEADLENEQVTFMVDGKFRIEGDVSEPTLLSIRIRPEMQGDFNPTLFESSFIWIDNTAMTLHGKKGSFEYSDVSGFRIQDEHEQAKEYVKSQLLAHRSRIDSLSEETSKEAKKELKELTSISEIYIRNKSLLEYSYLYPNSFISVYNYSWFVKWIPEMVPQHHAASFYSSISDSLKTTAFGMQIRNYIENLHVNEKLKLGDRPYEFALKDSSGTEVSLQSLKGNIVLLDFWASSCGPCRGEHANYVKLYDRFKENGFEILSVSQDLSRERWLEAMKKDHISWPSVWDETMTVSKYTYLVSAIPQNYLIDREGIIIAEGLRGKALENTLTKLFAE